MTRPEMSLQNVIEATRRLIEARFVGVLSTVDQNLAPHSRWMGAVVDGDRLDRLMSVSARGSRKLVQIRDHPKVCWLFSDAHDDEVVQISGTIRLLEDETLAGPVWEHLDQATRNYSMNVLSEAENLWFVGLETVVEQVEYMNPAAGLTHPVVYRLGD